MRPTLSLCLIVKNEAQLLDHALRGLRELADECIVIDTGSTDATIAIARAAGATVFDHPWDGNFAQARNAYLERATGSWILVIDGDETIAERDRPKIRPLLEASGVSGYTTTVYDYGRNFDLLRNWRPNTGAYPDEERRSECPGRAEFDVVRLFRNAPSVRYEGESSHTNPVRALRALGGAIVSSGIVIHHYQWLKGGDGFIAAKQRDRLEAERRAADTHPDDCRANMNVGRTLFALGRDEEALTYLTRAVDADPTSRDARVVRGLAYSESDRPERALVDLTTALELDPDFAEAWVVLGIAYDAMGRTADAEHALRRALELRPDHPLASNSLGVVLLDAGRTEEAERCFRRALQILPDHATASVNLASLYESLGDLEAARRTCREGLAHSPDDGPLLQKAADLSI